MFDCVMPPAPVAHGLRRGKVNIRNARYANDRLLDEGMAKRLSGMPAYLHHLNRCGEYLGAMLLSWHNLAFIRSYGGHARCH